jgi:hypothetical protein
MPMKDFGPAFGVANAVLYEGYLLFPYTASTQKNRVRWQFGVVVPEDYLAANTGEHAEQQTEVLFEHAGAPDIDVLLRFLQVEARTVEVAHGDRFDAARAFAFDGKTYVSFDEAVERELLVNVRSTGAYGRRVPLHVQGGREIEALRDRDGVVVARIVRERWPIAGSLIVEVESMSDGGAARFSKLRVRVQNRSAVVPGERSAALRTSLVSTHVLLAIDGGEFLSVLDPPASAAHASAALANRQTFPVLIGDARADARRAALMLSSPIILYDFPALGPRTEADAFDATEIDELLTLSVLSLSDDERAEARATDPRARAIVERAERFDPAAVARLHLGALRRFDADQTGAAETRTFERLADPFADAGPPPGWDDCVFIDGTKVTRGSSVRLRPAGRADIWDSVLTGKRATVRAIHVDLDERTYVAVTVDDDPASDLHEWYGRSFFFSPHEVEPLTAERTG